MGWVHIQTQTGWGLGPSCSNPSEVGGWVRVRTQSIWVCVRAQEGGDRSCPNPRGL